MDMKERYKTLSAVMLILIREENGKEQIILQKRKNTGYMDGYWDYAASGHVEYMESMKMAMKREAKEELCIDIDLEDLEFVSLIHKKNDIDTIYYNGYFKATKWKGEPKVGEPSKNEEIKWFDIDNLPDNLVDDRKEAIKNYINQLPYSEFGWNNEKDNNRVIV